MAHGRHLVPLHRRQDDARDPVPAAAVDLKYQAKPFIDVTVDRLAKGVGALILLVLIKALGLGLGLAAAELRQLTMMAICGRCSRSTRARDLAAFRRSIEQQDVRPARPPPRHGRSSLDRDAGDRAVARRSAARDLRDRSARGARQAQLVTPLLLRHESPEVRARALRLADTPRPMPALAAGRRARARRRGRRGAARGRAALATLRGEAAADVMRRISTITIPLLVVAGRCALAERPIGRRPRRETLQRLAADTRESAAELRRQVARALATGHEPRDSGRCSCR